MSPTRPTIEDLDRRLNVVEEENRACYANRKRLARLWWLLLAGLASAAGGTIWVAILGHIK